MIERKEVDFDKWKKVMLGYGWNEIREAVKDMGIKSILNVGLGIHGGVDSIRWLRFLDEVFPGDLDFVTLELFDEYIEKKVNNPYIRDVVAGDVRLIDEVFDEDSFDLVFWSAGPEHIYKDEWADTFRRIDIVAKKLCIIHLPWGSGYDKDKTHLSKSTRCGEMELFGFECLYGGDEDTKQGSIKGYKVY